MDPLTTEFISLYNRADHLLRNITNSDRGDPFWKRVRWGSRDHAHIRRWQDDLLELHELRNAIIHDRNFPEEELAIPSEKAVARFRELVEDIESPERLLPRFASEVHVFGVDSPLQNALKYMEKRNFSKIVVRDDGLLKLLTASAVTRWLARQADHEAVGLATASLSDVMRYNSPEPCRFMARDDTVAAARHAFLASIGRQRRLYAIIITEHGKLEEDPLGIVTPYDLMQEDR
jgi:CBS domain-containing protein